MIEVKQLIKKYLSGDKKELVALKGINLKFSDNEFTSILGPSGCGKTTLLNLLGGLDLPTEGEVIANSLSLNKMNDNEIDSYRNNQIGFILQNYYLIPNFTVIDNIKIGLSFGEKTKKEIDEKSYDMLKKVGMEEYAKSYPKQLSGGQQQRVAIARALINDPSIILADEPTGSLDAKTAKEIMDLLKSLSEDKLIIMVTHNEDLAKKYSTRIIKMNDGLIVDDKVVTKTKGAKAYKENKKTNLSFITKWKLALKSLLNKKLKTIMTMIATSFGMVGISFFLGLNHGFNKYAEKFSSSIASSTPIVITPYISNTSIIPSEEYNTTIEYPSDDEIYPLISTQRETSYQYNNFTTKYFNLLNTMQEEKLIREYYKLYSTSYSLNLLTSIPDNIEDDSTSLTYTQISNANRNIFHVLYGDLDDYDVIAGTLPKEDTDLVLIVNKYNSISFSYLKSLGFYNSNVEDSNVIDKSSKKKVKPIKFSDVLNKEYKAFTNNDFYLDPQINNTKDDLGIDRSVGTYFLKGDGDTNLEKYESLYKGNTGLKLKISGIIRPKNVSGISAINPSLCYQDSLMQRFVNENNNSTLTKNYTNNIVFKYNGKDENILNSNGSDKLTNFVTRLEQIKNDYLSSKDKPFPTSEINNLLSEFFVYYQYNYSFREKSFVSGFDTFLSNAKKLGVELIDESLLGKDLSDENVLNEQIDKIKKDILSPKQMYNDIISLVSYMNAYSLIEQLVIYPTGVSQRGEILDRLDEFNQIQPNSSIHAANESEVVLYAQENKDYRVEQVEVVMSIVYEILAIFVSICLIVASSMIAVITSSNVIERTKEIGLLRSLGAKKKDIALLFEYESFTTGLLSGIFSSILTFIMQIPLNLSISKNYPGFGLNAICNFTWYHMFIVILISVSVGLISALIPSIKAAKKNPVDCLRSE